MRQLTCYDDEGGKIATFPSRQIKGSPHEWISLNDLVAWLAVKEKNVLPSTILERYGGRSLLAPQGLFEYVDFTQIKVAPLGFLIQEARKQEQSGRNNNSTRFLVSADWVEGVVQARHEGYFRVDLTIVIGFEMTPDSGILAHITDSAQPGAEWYVVGKFPERRHANK
jgi:hypothetical protein